MSNLLTSYCQNELDNLLKSLQKEFEYMLSFSSDKVLEAKKAQIKRIEYITELMSAVNERYTEKDGMINKLQACALHYCITPEEVDSFVSKSIAECKLLATQMREPLDVSNYKSFPKFVQRLVTVVNNAELNDFRRVHGFKPENQ